MAVKQDKVLVVVRSQNNDLASALHARLRKAGFLVFDAGSVSEGWNLALNEEVDAAVIAVDLPTVFGWELASRMRADRRFDSCALIMLGDTNDPDEIKKANEVGADHIGPPWPAEMVERLVAAGIIDAQRAEMRGVRVLLLTDICEIEGTVHLPLELARFSDGWEAIVGDNRSFVPVTDARVSTLDGRRLVATTSFMQVTKSQVRGVLPLDAAIGEMSVPTPGTEVSNESARLISRLTRVAAGLAQELAAERHMPVEQMLEEVVARVGEEPEYEGQPHQPSPAS